LDEANDPQAVDRALGENQAATEQRSELRSAKRPRRERGQHVHDVVGSMELDAVDHFDQTPLSGIPDPARCAPGSIWAEVVLAQQEHLDGQMRVSQQRRECNELVEYLDYARALGRATNLGDFAVLTDAHNSSLGR
jgi:hypothetical protein